MWLLKNTELGGRHIGPTVAERVRAGIWLFTQIYGGPFSEQIHKAVFTIILHSKNVNSLMEIFR